VTASSRNHGGVYGKQHDVSLEDHNHCDLMLCHASGACGPCGSCDTRSHVFGDEFQDNFLPRLLTAEVTRHVSWPDGATFRTTTAIFLVQTIQTFTQPMSWKTPMAACS